MGSDNRAWTIVLRCYKCSGKFTMRGVSFSSAAALPLVAPCPHCDARPMLAADESTVHKVFDLRRRQQSAAA